MIVRTPASPRTPDRSRTPGHPRALGHPRATAALVTLSLAAFTYVSTEVMPVGLLTLIARDLHREPAQVGRLVTGYALVVVLAAVPLTRLTARVPRRLLLAADLGLFALATLVTALAPGYPVLLVARLFGGLSQALFWSIAAPTVAGLFPPERRGRAVARLSVGTSVAPVAGIPAGTWLGQQAGWRTTFLVLTAITIAATVAVIVLLPGGPAGDTGQAVGTEPDRRRYTLLVAATVIGVAGFETAYTYITPYLLDVTRVAAGALAPLLLVGGACGVVGTVVTGRFTGLYPWRSMTVPMTLVALSLLALYLGGPTPAATVVALVVLGFSFSGFVTALPNSALITAPGSQDLASAGVNSAFNVGIAGGSFLGGALIGAAGTRSVALVATGLSAVSAAILAGGALLRPRRPAPLPVVAPALAARRARWPSDVNGS